MSQHGAPGIAAVGAYAPCGRLPASELEDAWGRSEASGIESVAVRAADEDALTMAHAAARRALSAGGIEGESIRWLGLASTTPPLAEGELVARLRAMLAVPERGSLATFTASTRAGTRALLSALDADRLPALVVASDCPRGEPGEAVGQAAGAGAAALLVTADAPASIRATAEYSSPYPGTRFRRTGDDRTRGLDVTSYDRQAFTETLGKAVDGLDIALSDAAADSDPDDDPDGDEWNPDAAAVQAPDGKLPYRAAGALGVSTEAIRAAATVHDLGDTGAASVPLGIARALDAGHDRVLAAAHGSGAGADAVAIDCEGSVPSDLALGPENGDGEERSDDPTQTLSYAGALRRRGEITPDPPEGGGAYVSLPSWRRSLPQRYRLVAGECSECGALAFPPEGACPACGALSTFEPAALPGSGTVEAVTEIARGGAPPEFAEQQARNGSYGVAIVGFDGPGKEGGDDDPGENGHDDPGGSDGDDSSESVDAPVQVALDHPVPDPGDRIRAVIRRIYTQEGVTRYGLKVRPE